MEWIYQTYNGHMAIFRIKIEKLHQLENLLMRKFVIQFLNYSITKVISSVTIRGPTSFLAILVTPHGLKYNCTIINIVR